MKNCTLITKTILDHNKVYNSIKKQYPNAVHNDNGIDYGKQPYSFIIYLPSVTFDDPGTKADCFDKDDYIDKEYIYFSLATYRHDSTLKKFAKFILSEYPDMIIMDEEGIYYSIDEEGNLVEIKKSLK